MNRRRHPTNGLPGGLRPESPTNLLSVERKANVNNGPMPLDIHSIQQLPMPFIKLVPGQL